MEELSKTKARRSRKWSGESEDEWELRREEREGMMK